MSKLYFIGGSDSRKTAITSRGHKSINGKVMFNWTGGQSPEGDAFKFDVRHEGDKVKVNVNVHNQFSQDFTIMQKNPVIRGSQTREALNRSGYELIKLKGKEALLKDKETGKLEFWYQNDSFSGYVIEIKGKGYEFVRSVNPKRRK